MDLCDELPEKVETAVERFLKLPFGIRRRVCALKNLQLEMFQLEGSFYKRLNDLEREFERLYAPLFSRRRDILAGDVEPNDHECNWPYDDSLLMSNEVSGDQLNAIESLERSGIPDFWLTIFRNAPILSDHKEDADEPILRKLINIQCTINGAEKRPGFCLDFYFAPNDYFSNPVLTKEYFVRFEPAMADPLNYEGPEIIQAQGCTINWKPGKNVTVKTIKKTIKNKNRGDKKIITKTVKTSSFFNFFTPPTICLDDADDQNINEDLEDELQSDFELGQYFRETVVPRAVLLFTGEGICDDNEPEEVDSDNDNDDEVDRTTESGRL